MNKMHESGVARICTVSGPLCVLWSLYTQRVEYGFIAYDNIL